MMLDISSETMRIIMNAVIALLKSPSPPSFVKNWIATRVMYPSVKMKALQIPAMNIEVATAIGVGLCMRIPW